MIEFAGALVLLSIIDNVINLLTWTWWLWLFFVGWFYYKWAQDHLSFSPLLTLAVGAILVYFLVIEHPIIGSVSVLFWTVLMSGILWLLPLVNAFFNTILHPLPKTPKLQQGAEMQQYSQQQFQGMSLQELDAMQGR